jgi:hypothetical protein
MATNIIGHPDKRRYNPSRDIAYCWPNILKSSLDRVSEGSGAPWFIDHLNLNNITNEELCKVSASLAKYMGMCNNPNDCPSTVRETITASGLMDCGSDARTAVYAALGETMLIAFFLAVRDVLVEDEPSPLSDSRLAQKIKESTDAITKKRDSFLSRVAMSFRLLFPRSY